MNISLQQIRQLSTFYKIKTGISLLPIIDKSNISHYPLLYIGSNLDLEFPLILQAKKIVMLDPCFSNEENIGKILQKVITYDSEQPEINRFSSWHTRISFYFDFGRGAEKVHVDLVAKTYQEYEIILPLGYIVEFNSKLDHTLFKPDALNKLLIGGLIINNHQSPLRNQNLSLFDILKYGKNIDKVEEIKARKLGLSTIRISRVPFAIYQKTENNPRLLDFAEREV